MSPWQNDLILIQVSSAGFKGGNFAKISINDAQVEVEKNDRGHDRGLHIVVIDPVNGEVELAKVFDTYWDSKEFETWIYQGIPDGSIVCAACKDDCRSSLSVGVKLWFDMMGSQEIWNLEYRQGFAFIGIIGKTREERKLNEKRSIKEEYEVSIS